MSNTQEGKRISFDVLLDYVFNNLNEEKETEVENFLEENPTYAEVVDDILTYCLDEDIKTKEVFEQRLVENKLKILENYPVDNPLENKKGTIEDKKRRKWGFFYRKRSGILGAAAVLFFIVISIFLFRQLNRDKEVFSEKDVRPDTETLYSNLEMIGGRQASNNTETWVNDIIDGRLRKARIYLEKMPIEQLNKDEKGKLYLGILHLLDVNGDLEQSINLLEELRVANSNYYPRGSSYLITALVLNGKVDRARELYEEDKAKNGLSDEALAPNILNRINSN